MKTKKYNNDMVKFCLLGLALGVVFGQLLPYIGTRFLGTIGILSPKDYFQLEFMKFNLNSLYISVLSYFIYYYIIKMEDRIAYRNNLHLFKLKLIDIILYILIGFSLICLGSYIAQLSGQLFPHSAKNLLSNEETWTRNNILIDILMIGLIGPIVQEIVSRDLFPKLILSRKNYSIKTIILLQAIFFGVSHMNIVQAIYGTILGIFIMVAILWMDNLYVGILIHCSANIYSTAISPFLYEYGINLKLFLAILTVPLLIIGYKKRKYDALDRNNPYWK